MTAALSVKIFQIRPGSCAMLAASARSAAACAGPPGGRAGTSRISRMAASVGSVGNRSLGLLAQPLDAEMHGLPRLQEDRGGLDAQADARRRAGEDHVARMQGDH